MMRFSKTLRAESVPDLRLLFRTAFLFEFNESIAAISWPPAKGSNDLCAEFLCAPYLRRQYF